MKVNYFLYLILSVLIFACKTYPEKSESRNAEARTKGQIQLNRNWQFRQYHTQEWMEAEVPGYVHTDLLRNSVIEDPYYRRNEIKIQWIEEEDWEYKTTFNVDEQLLKHDNVSLVFKGIDTYADIYINNQKISSTDNMFVEWKFDVKTYLKKGDNSLKVLFRSPIYKADSAIEKLGYDVPINNEDWVIRAQHNNKTSTFSRKAQFHYGWDWAPRIVSSGIWRPVFLEFWNDFKLEDSFFQLKELNDSLAIYQVAVEINTKESQEAKIKLVNSETNNLLAEQGVFLEPGENIINLDFEIKNPKLWWPRGLGEQYLYEFETVVENVNGISSNNQAKIGVRTIEWVTDKDDIGETFYCKVNGKPVFWKGANYVPLDVFFPQVTPQRYDKFFQAIVAANFNSLRVWGGAIYENDIFYDLADKYGILIWNDFSFACTMVPGNQEYLDNVKKEAAYNVKRLRNHPSLSLWCGNNEILMFWNDRWDHLKTQPGGDKLQKAYDDIFMDILPSTVKEFDPGKFYWPSSPSTYYEEYIEEESHLSGDKHDWSVFFGLKDPRAYNRPEGLARFISEYGLQSYPSLNTVKKFAEPRDFDAYSPVMEQHHKVRLRDGNEKMMHYIGLNYKKPKSFEMLLYVSQVMQAEGIKTGAEAHRRNMPYTMGSLYWQSNDCWPVTSWSSIDYYGTWKALHYKARGFFADMLVSPWIENNTVTVNVVSDLLEDKDCRLDLDVYDFEGKSLFNNSQNITVKATSSEKIIETSISNLNVVDTTQSVLKITLISGDTIVSSNFAYFARPKNLSLPNPGLKWKITDDEGTFNIVLSAEKFAKNVYLEVADIDGHFSDNFFDLLAGKSKLIRFIPNEHKSLEEIQKQLNVISLVDSYN